HPCGTRRAPQGCCARAKSAMKAEQVPPNIPTRDNTLTVTLTCSGTAPSATEQKALRFINRSAFCSRKHTTGGPDGRWLGKNQQPEPLIIGPGTSPQEALLLLKI